MLDKFNQLAEQAATSVSRRQFLGRFGRGAGAAAAACAGLLACASPAWAAKRIRMCSEFSAQVACRGVPMGSPCLGTNGGSVEEGRCWGPKISPGVYNCNDCIVKGGKGGKGGEGPKKCGSRDCTD